jgi:alpha-tubulin suppressor-like RCC1 family protein
MPNFVSGPNGELSDLYLTSTELVDQFVGSRLWSWGLNTTGQLGDNGRTHRSSPVQTVSGGTNWKLVAAKGAFDFRLIFPPPTPPQFVLHEHTASIKTDNSLWLWGSNSVAGAIGRTGQLGNNNTLLNTSSPVQTVSGGTNWAKVAVGSDHTLAIKTDGRLWVWGYNQQGELGDNTVTRRSSPVQVVGGGTNWKEISGGNLFSAAIKSDGTLWLWGANAFGQLGDNSRTNRSSPVQILGGGNTWSKVSINARQSAAIKTDGTLWLWGDNSYGQLGTNNITHRSSPVQTVAGGNNWLQVSMGFRSVAAIKTDGTLWTWGNNNNGVLGDNTIIHRSSPVQTVTGGTNWKEVGLGAGHGAAIKTDSTLWTWGGNGDGQLGTNNRTHRSSPGQTVTGGTNWRTVSVAMYGTKALTY